MIGAAWGANGYTTASQVNELARRLELGPGRVLFDMGTSRGWPALYLAKSTERNRRTQRAAIADGLLSRGLFSARRPRRESAVDSARAGR